MELNKQIETVKEYRRGALERSARDVGMISTIGGLLALGAMIPPGSGLKLGHLIRDKLTEFGAAEDYARRDGELPDLIQNPGHYELALGIVDGTVIWAGSWLYNRETEKQERVGEDTGLTDGKWSLKAPSKSYYISIEGIKFRYEDKAKRDKAVRDISCEE